LSGVVMPIEVGVFRNCCSYCIAAAMPALVAPAVVPALLPPLVLLVLLLLLLLHAAMASVEVATATTAASVLLIRASFWQPPGSPGRPRVCWGHVNDRLLS
jgi:uncharacterized membrane protein YdbT with pleckstrin-like domain